MTNAIVCDWCDKRIVPGEHFVEIIRSPMQMVSDGYHGFGDPSIIHLHSDNTELHGGMTCERHYHS